MIATSPAILTTKDMASVMARCGEDPIHFERCFTGKYNPLFDQGTNIKAAESLARTISRGLPARFISEDSAEQFINKMNAALLHPYPDDLKQWQSMPAKQQEAFHATINAAKRVLADSGWSPDKVRHFNNITDRALKNYPITDRNFSSEEVLALFQRSNLDPRMAPAVERVLKLRDNPEQAVITANDLKEAGLALIVRAVRLTESGRNDGIRFFNACELAELGINCLNLLGKNYLTKNRSQDFGSLPAISALSEKHLKLVKDSIRTLGERAYSNQDMQDFVQLKDFLDGTLQ